MEAAIEAKKRQRADLAAKRKEFKRQAKEHDVSDAAQKFLDYKSQQNGGLESFPKPSINHENSKIAAAQKALEAPTKIQWTEKELSVFEKRRQEIEVLKAINTPEQYQNDHHKARCLTIQQRDASITSIDKAWLHKYRSDYPNNAAMLDKLFTQNQSNQK
jgi:hypothetical protein